MGERRALLHVMIAEQPEVIALRKDSNLVIERAVFEVKGQFRYEPVAANHLNKVPGGECLALLSAQHEKSVDRTFDIAYRDLLCLERAGLEQRGADQQDAEQPEVGRMSNARRCLR